MGTLRDASRGVEILLPAQVIVGRADSCRVRIDAPYVSSEHAALRWTGEAWEIRDLASRNGTFVGAHRLEPGQRVCLEAGATLHFGHTSSHWVLTEAGPPGPIASAGADQRVAEDGLLLLPDGESPEVCVYSDGRGGWTAEADNRVWPLRHGAEITAGGRTWTLELPSVLLPTREAERPDDPSELSLVVYVSRDEEHIELALSVGGRTWRLPHRAHGYLVLTLARARTNADPSLPASEQGWLYHDELADGLGLPGAHFNMAVFRVRQQLKDAGVPGAEAVLERRRGSGQIRLAVGKVSVESL